MPGRLLPNQERPGSIDEALRAAALALRTQRAPDAERLIREVLKSDARNALAAKMLGQALLMQGRPHQAVDPLRAATRGAGDPETETLLGRALAGAGRAKDALEPLRRAISRRPPFPLAFLELGGLLRRLGRPDEAATVLERGLALIPDAAILRIDLAHLRLQFNDRAAARALFAEVHAAAPQRSDAVIGLAEVMAMDGDYASAAEHFRYALTLRPDEPTIRLGLGRCLLELGEREAGEAALRAATQAAPTLSWEAVKALSATPHGRAFLRPSSALRYLGGEPA